MKKLLIVVLTLLACNAFAQNMQKNGTIYKEHPYIDAVNNSVASFLKADWDGFAKNFADTARFYDSGSTKKHSLADEKKNWSAISDKWDQVAVTKQGYPDGLQYEKDPFTVQSWWIVTGVNKKTKKPVKVYMVQFDEFNKDGKIATEISYYDPTAFIEASK